MTKSELKEKETPLVSVIVPFFNREFFLADSIKSVIAQTYENWELLLVNDGSTDKSNEIVENYKQKYPSKIHLFSHLKNQNKGASASRNLGVARAKGEYLTFLDSDDVYYPYTLEKELAAFENNPQADVVCGTAKCWFSWSKESEKWEKDFTIDLVLETEKLYQPPDLFVHNMLSGGRKAHTNCVIMKSSFAKKIGVFEENYKYSWEDQVSWAKITLSGKIYVLDAVLAKYRLHPASTCAVEMQNGQDVFSVTFFLEWLETYLKEQKIENADVWRSTRNFQRKIRFEIKIRKIKQLYRYIFPLHIRYKLRDKLTRIKKIF